MSESFLLEAGSALARRTFELSFVPINPVSNALSHGLWFSSIFCLVVAWIAVILRIYTRVYLLRMAGWDDWMSVISLLCFTGFETCVFVISDAIQPGQTIVSAHVMTLSTNLELAAESLYIWCMVFVKISLGIFFLRIVMERWQRRTIYFMVSLSSAMGFVYFWYALFQCGVPNNNGIAEWEARLNNQCSQPIIVKGISYTHGAINMLTDIALLLVPIPTLQAAKIARREKYIVTGILGIAVCGCAGSAARLAFIPSLYDDTESFWIQIIYLVITASVECSMAITASSIATLRPLLRQVNMWLHSNASSFRFTLSYTRKSSRNQSDYGNSLEKSSASSKSRFNANASSPSRTDPVGTDSTRSHVNQTFFLDTLNPTMNDTQHGTDQPGTFFLDTVRSMDRRLQQGGSGNSSNDRVDTLVPLPVHTSPSNGPSDVETGVKRNSRGNRATWWPLPGSSVVEDEKL